MQYGFLRVAAASPALRVADPAYNAARIQEEMARARQGGVEVLVFPELSLSGYTCGDLFSQGALAEGCRDALLALAKETADCAMLVFVGLPVRFAGKLYNCAAALAGGKIVGMVPKTHLPNYGEFYELRHFSPAPAGVHTLDWGEQIPFGTNLLFRDARHPDAVVAAEICEDVWVSDAPSVRHTQAGATLIVNLSASNELIGKREYRKHMLAAQSGKCACGYLYCDAGMGESTTDMVFAGNHLVYENGALLAEAVPFSGDGCTADLDVQFLARERTRMNTAKSGAAEGYTDVCVSFVGEGAPAPVLSATPFVPAGEEERAARASLILDMQAHALKKRLEHTQAKTAVIGISGGLDSTLALLVTVRAFDLLSWQRSKILAYTMPGFGTTQKTKNNALLLMQELGVTARTVSVAAAVKQHFADIEHDPALLNATYENAQARYRTMILMDVANETGGLVIGTGDLSELALGWCTYNGDHMSMYAVNGGVPKTLVKYLVRAEAERLGGNAAAVLRDILATEISPELLPPDEAGNIAQKTEDLVGPYDLHDFFLYRFVRRGDAPKKIYALAQRAFAQTYDAATIKKWLVQFYRRFFAQQFKRSCLPDGVKIGSVALSPRGDWRMPSDASAALWLAEVEAL